MTLNTRHYRIRLNPRKIFNIHAKSDVGIFRNHVSVLGDVYNNLRSYHDAMCKGGLVFGSTRAGMVAGP